MYMSSFACTCNVHVPACFSRDLQQSTADVTASTSQSRGGGKTGGKRSGAKAAPAAAADDDIGQPVGGPSTPKRRKAAAAPTAADPSPAAVAAAATSSSSAAQPEVVASAQSPSLRRRTLEGKPKVMFTGVIDEQGRRVGVLSLLRCFCVFAVIFMSQTWSMHNYTEAYIVYLLPCLSQIKCYTPQTLYFVVFHL